MKSITIFTPTYNRAYTLPKLYESLCRQSCNDFIWLIVDDGSTDGTKALIDNWIAESKIDIKYFYQENGGKMRAHNKGVKECETPLFACVDSDDYLTDNAIEEILSFWNQNFKGEDNIVGMITNRLMVDSKNRTPRRLSEFPNLRSCRIMDLSRKYGNQPETVIVFISEILKQYPFPEIKGEKFITEAVVSDQLDQKYNVLLCPKSIVICEYLPDGYTRNISNYYKSAPKGWTLYYNQQILFYRHENTFKQRIKAIVYYIIMSKKAKERNIYSKCNDKSFHYLIARLIAPYYSWKHKSLF